MKETSNEHEEYQYINLIKTIFEKGTVEQSRNGKTKSIFGHSMRFSLKDGCLPLITTKKTAWKTCLKELLFFIRGETDNRILKQNGEFSFIEISVPTNPILKFFFGFYLGKIIPILGKLFLGNPSDYKMLWKYTTQFKNCKEVLSIFEKNNLEVKYHSYFFGCATGVSGRKK